MSLDFPSNPTPGQVYQNYVWSATDGVWRASNSAQTFPVQVSNGGTGAGTLAQAQDNLGVGLTNIPVGTLYKGASGTATVNSTGRVDFSGTEFVTLANVFSSAFKNYRVILRVAATVANVALNIRYSNANTPDASAQYYITRVDARAASVVAASASAGTTLPITDVNSTALSPAFVSLDIFSPNLAETTQTLSNHSGYNAGGWFNGSAGSHFNVATTFDGFRLFPGSGLFTGFVEVFGYND